MADIIKLPGKEDRGDRAVRADRLSEILRQLFENLTSFKAAQVLLLDERGVSTILRELVEEKGLTSFEACAVIDRCLESFFRK
jgi:hypothetical protein